MNTLQLNKFFHFLLVKKRKFINLILTELLILIHN